MPSHNPLPMSLLLASSIAEFNLNRRFVESPPLAPVNDEPQADEYPSTPPRNPNPNRVNPPTLGRRVVVPAEVSTARRDARIRPLVLDNADPNEEPLEIRGENRTPPRRPPNQRYQPYNRPSNKTTRRLFP